MSDESSGPQPVQWIAVTLLLSMAFLALLQLIGPQLAVIFERILGLAGGLLP
jgi:hypothetical protein